MSEDWKINKEKNGLIVNTLHQIHDYQLEIKDVNKKIETQNNVPFCFDPSFKDAYLFLFIRSEFVLRKLNSILL